MTENNETEGEPPNTELQRSPGSVCSQQETKLQRLKRSLSFKTILRSKSVENFFQRTNSDAKFPPEILPPPPTPPPTPPSAVLPVDPTANEQPARKSHPVAIPLKPVRTHTFQEFVFKKPTFCDICHHMIVGYSKRGWRCKLCKINAHPQCGEDACRQQCVGKLPMGFRRNFSSPLLIHEQYGVVKEAMPMATSSKVDPVYEALRFGTSLAQMSRSSFGSFSESPTKHLGNNGDIEEEPDLGTSSSAECEAQTDTVPLENGTVESEDKGESSVPVQVNPTTVGIKASVGPYARSRLQTSTITVPSQVLLDLLSSCSRLVCFSYCKTGRQSGKFGQRLGFDPDDGCCL
ncbi:SH3 and cysteine-rich domain-containing protein 2-like [Leucoraja erinacea]|uniref:SH3 and cysteine-rich domain-containing protein 2-like n=1 Tax=Leucoraja erinaceus TaxID=7782 RepID=UPI002454CD53|nr:SH3 and cysteine-rich domain-containing protein 2-like [Leucoraja erinacea]